MDWIITAQSLLQFFYPAHCPACKHLVTLDEIICKACAGLIKPVTSIYIPLTEKKAMQVLAASSYDHVLKTLVLRKFAQDVLASKQLGKLMLTLIDIKQRAPDIIVPIPLHWNRYARRGYNQAAVMANIIGKALNIPVAKLIYRKKKTLFQSRLKKDAREKNIAQAFGINNWYGFKNLSYVEGKKVLLIDDLCTTGVTLQQAGKTLLALKPASITAAVACRAI